MCIRSVVTDSVFVSSSAYSDDPDLVAVELLGPVALLAGVARRAQVVTGDGDRPRVGVERDREDLPQAESFALTNHGAPGPMWHWTQATRAWGPSW